VERTLIIIKPDAVQRGLIGEIIRRFENRGLRLVGMKLVHLTPALASQHYAVHKEKSFFGPLIDYITSAPVVVMVLEGSRAVELARNTIGATKPVEALAGTIRGDFGMEVGRNLVHGSDSAENAQKEVALFFTTDELIDWARSTDPWIFEG